jgi:uncharacterized protein YggE
MTNHSESPSGNARLTWGANPLRLLVVLVAATLLVVVAIAGIEIGRSMSASAATISVGGNSTIQGAPDTASFNIGVHTMNASAKAAEQINKQKIDALIAALRVSGVTSKEMQTSGFNIYQNTNSNGVVTGFSVDNTLNVTMHHVTKVRAAIDAATAAVGNGIQLNGITFSITNQSKLLASARAKAMKNARLMANQLASAGGAHVTGIVRVSDQENPVTPVFYGDYAMASGKALHSSVPIQGGRQSVTVQVSVVYSLG